MSTSEQQFSQVDFLNLPLSEHSLYIEQMLYINDNLDDIPTQTGSLQETARVYYPTFPSRILMYVSFICKEGSIKIRLNLKDYLLRRGDSIIIVPGNIVENLEFSGDCRFVVFAFAQSNFADRLSASSVNSFRNFLNQNPNPARFHCSEETVQDFLYLYHLMRSSFSKIQPDSRVELMEGFIRIYSCLGWNLVMESAQKQQEVGLSRNELIFSQFLKDVRDCFLTHRTVDFYAGRQCLSPKYFARIIKEVSGKQASEWIKEYVILEAKTLLKVGDYTILQISEMLNFPNPSFFCKYFKSAVGCSPKKYK